MIISFKVKGLVENRHLYQYIQTLKNDGIFYPEEVLKILEIFDDFYWRVIDQRLIIEISSINQNKSIDNLERQNKYKIAFRYNKNIFKIMIRLALTFDRSAPKYKKRQIFFQKLAIIVAIIMADNERSL